MWSRIPPQVFMIFLIVMTLLLVFTFWLSNIEEFKEYVPPHSLRVVVTLYLASLVLWLLDVLLYWNRISDLSVMKDRIVVMILVTVILFVFPVYWYGSPPFQIAAVAVTVGLLLPSLFFVFNRWWKSRPVISPEEVWQGGKISPVAGRFLQRFPDAARIVYGINRLGEARAHLLLHKRLPVPELPRAGIDMVLDIPVDHKSHEFQIGRERLYCYLFVNCGESSGVGLLPSANVGRALDYGFSDEEMEQAIENAKNSSDRWPPIGDTPLQAVLHRGEVYRL